jgi:hypothetical protein
MKLLPALAGGFAGALTLTALHEILRRIDPDAPRMDLLGMEALAKTLHMAEEDMPDLDTLFGWTMAADIVCNGLYYTLAGLGNKSQILELGTILGAAAGAGAVTLPEPLGLHEEPSHRTKKTHALTIGIYLVGGMVASAVMNALDKDED